jgi:small subunit ribosomal protein S20
LAKRTKSALKHARKAEKRRLWNREHRQALKTAIRQIRAAKTREEAEKLFPEIQSALDRSARRNIIHTNASRRLKSQLRRDIAFLK